jgi:hypothetical protein
MITLFDLRTNPDPETVAAIAALYDEQPRTRLSAPPRSKRVSGVGPVG